MEVHAGEAGEVRGEDVLHGGGVGDVGRAFVVDDEVVAIGVMGVGVRGEAGARGFIGGVHVLDDDVSAGFEALFKEIFLGGVIVAATAGDEKNAQGFRRGRGGGEAGECEGAGEEEGEAGIHRGIGAGRVNGAEVPSEIWRAWSRGVFGQRPRVHSTKREKRLEWSRGWRTVGATPFCP